MKGITILTLKHTYLRIAVEGYDGVALYNRSASASAVAAEYLEKVGMISGKG